MSDDNSIWSYFDKLDDEEEKQASCRLCSKVYCYKTTIYNLKHHLISKHNEELNVDPDSLINVVQRKIKKSDNALVFKEHRSPVWTYFENIGGDERSAMCTLCSKVLSYKTTITNLKSHLKNKHIDAYETLSQLIVKTKNNSDDFNENYETEYLEADEDPEIKLPAAEDNEVWDYFEHETGGRARCVVCRRSLAHEVAVLRTHLQIKHPKLLPALKFPDETVDTKDFLNIDDGDHFEEILINQDNRKSKRKLQSTSTPQKIRKKRLHCETSSDDEFLSKTKNNCRNEELDVFLKYIGTLLKDIPKDLFTKLQCNILNMVMTTKINHESKNDGSKEQNSEYYIVSNKVVRDMPPPQAINDIEVPSRSIVIQVPNSSEIPSSSDVIQNDDVSTEASSPLVIGNTMQNNDNNVSQNIDINESEWAMSDSSHAAHIGSEDGNTNNEIDAPVSSETPVILRRVRTRIEKKYPDFVPP